MNQLVRYVRSRLSFRYWLTRLRRLRYYNKGGSHDPQILIGEKGLLAGKKVVILGAGGLIGQSVTSEIVSSGAKVLLIDRDISGLSNVPDDLGEALLSIESLDLTRTADTDRFFDSRQFERFEIDGLVIVASTTAQQENFLKQPANTMASIFSTNVFGPAHFLRRFAESLKLREVPGSIVWFSSIHSELTGGWSSYSSSKAAVNMLIKEIALELAPYAVRVNVIAPGWCAGRDQSGADFFEHAPLGQRAIPPEYAARTVTYLLSDYYSAFTTGSILTLDAGVSLRSYRTPANPSEGDPHTRPTSISGF